MLRNELRSMTSLQSNSSQTLKPWNAPEKRQSKRLGLILWPFIVVIIRYHYYFTIIINFSFALLPLFRTYTSYSALVECGCGSGSSIALNIFIDTHSSVVQLLNQARSAVIRMRTCHVFVSL